jgi:hypothetical protein
VVHHDEPVVVLQQERDDLRLADGGVEHEQVPLPPLAVGHGRVPPEPVDLRRDVRVDVERVDLRRPHLPEHRAEAQGRVGDRVGGRGGDEDLVDLQGQRVAITA